MKCSQDTGNTTCAGNASGHMLFVSKLTPQTLLPELFMLVILPAVLVYCLATDDGNEI